MNRKINYKSFSIRLLISIIGTIISSFGVACFYNCDLGTDPISVFVDGLHNVFALSYGDISTICHIILATLIILFERKHMGLGTLIGVVAGGPFIDIFDIMLKNMFPVHSLGLQITLLLIGLITTGVGYGLTIVCKMGIGCFQFIPIIMADKTPLNLTYSQIISDAIFFIIGYLLGGVVGIGTIIAVLLTGYILDYTISVLEKYIDSLGPILI